MTFWHAQERARQAGGKLILRIEDLDRDRCRPEFREEIVEDLHWFGLRWEEGPDAGGAGRPPATSPGLLLYIMVDSVAATIDSVIAQGGELVQPIGADAPEITARFRDPAGNVIGLYQQPS